MATSTVEIVFGFKNNTTKKITVGPFNPSSTALNALKAKIIAFNNNYTPDKYQYGIIGSLGNSEEGSEAEPFDPSTYPLIVSKEYSELLDTNPIVDAYITTTNITEINLNV